MKFFIYLCCLAYLLTEISAKLKQTTPMSAALRSNNDVTRQVQKIGDMIDFINSFDNYNGRKLARRGGSRRLGSKHQVGRRFEPPESTDKNLPPSVIPNADEDIDTQMKKISETERDLVIDNPEVLKTFRNKLKKKKNDELIFSKPPDLIDTQSALAKSFSTVDEKLKYYHKNAVYHEPIIRKLGSGRRHQYAQDSAGQLNVMDLLRNMRNGAGAVRYNPDAENIYHLFTRRNPSVSQVLVPLNDTLLWSSNFNATLRTVVLIHGWLDNVTHNFNRVLVPAFLEADDVNVIVVDWCAGACTPNYYAAARNTVSSGQSVARFISWLNNATGADPARYHIAGCGLGGQQAGVVGRNLGGVVQYITGLDPAGLGFGNNDQKFSSTDGIYTEVIHSSVENAYLQPLGDVDFYPNGGVNMPGCLSGDCDHQRCYYYLAESLRTGGFTGRRCEDYQAALIGNCTLSETLPMGGITPKFGAQGVYYLQTNTAPPFSQG